MSANVGSYMAQHGLSFGTKKSAKVFTKDADIKENGGTTQHFSDKNGDSYYGRQDGSVDLFNKSGDLLAHDGPGSSTQGPH